MDAYENGKTDVAEAKDGGAEPGQINAAGLARPEDKPDTDCRSHCMHCGLHCIYLNDTSEEERT